MNYHPMNFEEPGKWGVDIHFRVAVEFFKIAPQCFNFWWEHYANDGEKEGVLNHEPQLQSLVVLFT